ncbi:MAG: AAA family ATPase [Clostridium sp.]
MKINKLIIKNFRSYEDETIFDFSTTKDKNIILIGGKNGAGKSTLFEAMKVCIYGPLAYRYQGYSYQYMEKIKDNINNKSLTKNNLDAFVEADIELNENADKNTYKLIRRWFYEKQSLKEDFKVYKNNSFIPLDEDNLTYFENYLNSIISPKIFEFFFFDGEHLHDFFIGKNSNNKIKQSFLSLCNFDTFEVLKKTMTSISKSNKNEDSIIENAKNLYLDIESKLSLLKDSEDDYINKLEICTIELDELTARKNTLEKTFRKQGGLLAEEYNSMNQEILSLEVRRSNINQLVKDFCNEHLPFLLIMDMLHPLNDQLNLENEALLYSTIKEKLEIDNIKRILLSKLPDDSINEISASISSALIDGIKPSNYDNNFKFIHNLSRNDSTILQGQIKSILDYDSSSIKELFKEHSLIGERIAEIRTKVNNSLDEDSLDNYLKEISELSSKILNLSELKVSLENSLDTVMSEIQDCTVQREKVKEDYLAILQKNKVLDMSSNIILILDDILDSILESKTDEIKSNFINIFNKIMQKNNIFDVVTIDKDLNVSLYKSISYTSLEVENLLNKMGITEVERTYGPLFIEDLCINYAATTPKDVVKLVMKNTQSKIITLRTKLNVDSFSSGEKQVYLLCLYWALLKTSGIEVPFIIDTPYARIDETHRDNLTNEYLSTISEQVIILSTNTEFDEQAYKKVKHRLNGEYLIQYDDKNNKTLQNKGYFYEV